MYSMRKNVIMEKGVHSSLLNFICSPLKQSLVEKGIHHHFQYSEEIIKARL